MEKLTKEVEMILVEKEENQKPIEFIQCLTSNSGWEISLESPKSYDRIVYLGRCREDGDMFAAYDGDVIVIYNGHLNSGKY